VAANTTTVPDGLAAAADPVADAVGVVVVLDDDEHAASAARATAAAQPAEARPNIVLMNSPPV
jgi:hypothetical protein